MCSVIHVVEEHVFLCAEEATRRHERGVVECVFSQELKLDFIKEFGQMWLRVSKYVHISLLFHDNWLPW